MMKIETKQRNIFAGHHFIEQKDEIIYKRKFDRINYEYLKLPEGWFKNKKVLDAGCGSALTNTHKLLTLGANVTGIDAEGEDDFNDIKLSQYLGSYKLMRGNILDLPFDDNSFDYVHCEGVLHHTINAKKGFGELARVCKPNGYVYISVLGKGGILGDLLELFRNKYKNDKLFKEFIDTLTLEKIEAYVNWLNNNLREDVPKIPLDFFGNDFLMTVKDRLQPLIYDQFYQNEVDNWYKSNNFIEIKRLTRNPEFNDYRKYLCPIYYNYSHYLSYLINGDGFIQMIGRKK